MNFKIPNCHWSNAVNTFLECIEGILVPNRFKTRCKSHIAQPSITKEPITPIMPHIRTPTATQIRSKHGESLTFIRRALFLLKRMCDSLLLKKGRGPLHTSKSYYEEGPATDGTRVPRSMLVPCGTFTCSVPDSRKEARLE